MNPTVDPVPFLGAAYGLGVLGLVGFWIWVRLERRKLRKLIAAVVREVP